MYKRLWACLALYNQILFFKSNNSSKVNAKIRHKTLQDFFVELLTSKGLAMRFIVIYASLLPIPWYMFHNFKVSKSEAKGVRREAS